MVIEFILRPLAYEDLDSRVRWINDPDLQPLFSFDPTTIERTREWFDRATCDPSRQDLSIIDKSNGRLFGMTGLIHIDRRNASAEFYITIGEADYRGKGIGLPVIETVLTKGFQELGLESVYLQTPEVNRRAQHVYERIGFRLQEISHGYARYSLSRDEF